jgi:hypothetical protein
MEAADLAARRGDLLIRHFAFVRRGLRFFPAPGFVRIVFDFFPDREEGELAAFLFNS